MLRIGTSGWTYKHWQDVFYPPHTPQTKWLQYYADNFNTVEINATFYRIPLATTTAGWQQKTPPDFRFAVKVSRLITHVHKLRDCEPILAWFFRELAPLKSKVLAYLFQIPPTFCPTPETLISFIALLPQENTYVFEFRHEACYTEPIIRLLAEQGMSFCIHDYQQLATPRAVTAKLVYIRLHGYRAGHSGSYPDEVLQDWASRIADWLAQGLDVLVYFNNDILGYAVQNARRLKSFLTRYIDES